MGKTTKYILITVGVVIVLLVIGKMTGLLGGQSKTQVATEKVAVRDIVETVTASGKIKPHLEVKISAEVSGEIVELPVREGDVVKKGQLLCKIRPDALKSAFERNVASYNTQKASVGNSKQLLAQAQATYDNQASIYKRDQTLFDNKVLTAAEFDAAKASYEGAKAGLEAAKQNVIGSNYGLAQSSASVQEAQADLDKTSIFSPIDGVISKLSVEKGDRVLGTIQFAGTDIMTVSDLSKMDVNVDVNENDINRIELGDSSNIDVDAFVDKKFSGAVSEIGSSANVVGTNADQVTNFTVKVRINPESYMALLNKTATNPSPFRPGLTATVDIRTNHVHGITVPIQSVTTREEKKATKPGDASSSDDDKQVKMSTVVKEYVFVYNAGKLKQVLVTTGIQDDSYIQVLTGLKKGDEVVSAPYSAISKTLSDGMLVEKVDKSKLFDKPADN
ncbi:HlyD family secretion protein [Mucilaginibacter mallensis]|uniref:HlyD family secretion protein n=1 Tax=Mucilaginibacter mallensis TaxID=652787 RepID=A0A1H1N222_MUCMA|nr:efflux RND transporter periplasmic adaptor subunit [Mucilaginibacter mallensis]SDR93044.1 HlyD family secretion protein [Mucilaginibacter mallensis]